MCFKVPLDVPAGPSISIPCFLICRISNVGVVMKGAKIGFFQSMKMSVSLFKEKLDQGVGIVPKKFVTPGDAYLGAETD